MNELLYNTISDVVKKSSELRSNLETTMSKGKPWPQTSMNAGLGDSSGFLSPLLISPCKEFATDSSLSKDAKDSKPAIKKVINYEYEDWLGQKITTNGLVPLTTSDRFDASKVLPPPVGTRRHTLGIPSRRSLYCIFSPTHCLKAISAPNDAAKVKNCSKACKD